MEKVTINYDTFLKMKEIAHEAVDESLKKIFDIKDDNGQKKSITELEYVENKKSLLLLFNTKLKGYKYKYGNDPLNIDTDFNYPFTLYYENKSKTWWVDLHNLSKKHASFDKIVKDKYGDTKLLGVTE